MKPIRILACLLAIPIAAGAGAAESTTRPNIVFIISDDQGWNDYGFMGHPHIDTPRLDQLAAESLTFERGYTPVPLCRSSLSSIVTGLYPHQHGVTGNDPTLPGKGSNGQTGRPNPQNAPLYQAVVDNFARQPNLIRDLTSKGYISYQTGKWWEGDPTKTAGFSEAMTVGTGKGDRHGGAGLAIGRDGLGPIRDFISREKDKPFLVWYAPLLPHAPHTPPQDLLEKYLELAPSESVARYWACIEWFDRTCGELIDLLENAKLRENTMIIYVCDNGWIQDPAKRDRFLERSKRSPYEGGVRTPIMISWPAGLKPRRDKEHLATTLDLWPTLAGLLKTQCPDGLPVINLTDMRTLGSRNTIFGETYSHDIADVHRPAGSLENRWLVSGDWKLIAPYPAKRPRAEPELYQVSRDPDEKVNLSAAEPDRVRELTVQLDTWWNP